MSRSRLLLLPVVALTFGLAAPLSGSRQNALSLQGSDPPPGGVWVDSLDLSSAPIRRGRGQRGSTTPPPPLVYKLSGVTYVHGLPLQSDADLTIQLGGAATKFVAMVGVDDGTPPAPPPPPPTGVTAKPNPNPPPPIPPPEKNVPL